jgi:hypothetical protein
MRIFIRVFALAACLSLLMTSFAAAAPNSETPVAPDVAAQSALPATATPAPAPAVAPKKVVAPRSEPRGIVVDPNGIHIGDERGINVSMGPENGNVSWFAQFISLIAVIAPFATMVAIFAIVLYFRHRRRVILHETLRAMIEKGQPIPPELLSGGVDARDIGRRRSAYGDLRGGLVLVCVGAAFFYLHGKWGIIPFAIGVALLIVSAFERWEKNKQGTNP